MTWAEMALLILTPIPLITTFQMVKEVETRAAYTGMMGVDIAVDPSISDSYVMTYAETGEWLQYTINVIKAGHYNIKLNYNPEKENAKLSLLINNSETKKGTTPKTTGWQSLEIKDITLKKGSNNIRIYIDSGEIGIRSMEFITTE